MATIPNANEATFTDGSGATGDVLNVDTLNGIISVPNGKTLAFYSNAYSTLTSQVKNGLYCPPTSGTGTTAVPTSSATITAAYTGAIKVNPTASAVTAMVLSTGSIDGQPLTVINENATNAVTFAASGTSLVADGTAAVIAAARCMDFTWDASTSLWYHV